jgi:hypothetical protein
VAPSALSGDRTGRLIAAAARALTRGRGLRPARGILARSLWGGDIPSGTGIDHVPADGVPHTFLVAGDEPARLISLCFPGGFEEFFAAAGRPAGDEGLPPSEPPDVARLQQVGAEFGLQFVGPPLKPRDGEDR